MPIKPRESKCLPQVSLFCSQRSLACGWDCTTTTQHQLNSSSCEHLLFCALHCGKSLYITEAGVSISLVWVYFPPVFPVWNIHKKCPWTCLFWEPNRVHPHFFLCPECWNTLEDFHLWKKSTWFAQRLNDQTAFCYIKDYVNVTILFKYIQIKRYF